MTPKTKLLAIGTVMTLLLLSSAPASAVPFGMYGSVYDTDGNPIPHVNLTVTSNSTPANVVVVNVTNADGSFNGFGFGVYDYRVTQLTEPDPLAFIYKDGEGDFITVLAEKDGYEPKTYTFKLDGSSRIWFNMTLEKTPHLLQTTEGMLLVGGIVAFMGMAIFMFIHFDRKSRERVARSKKQKKRRRR